MSANKKHLSKLVSANESGKLTGFTVRRLLMFFNSYC